MSLDLTGEPFPAPESKRIGMLTAAEVAEKLGCGVRHFRERVANKPGFPAAYRPGGMRPRWDEDEVDEWISRGKEQRRPSTERSRHAAAA